MSEDAWDEYTQFKDTVHGYIKIYKPLVKEIINDSKFQRLKHIEQTGMGVLYPSATHNRFAHSLGVYHLGDIAFQSFFRNIKKHQDCYEIGPYRQVEKNWDINWGHWEILFKLACLLHDIGHTPFSHSLEMIYNLNSTAILERLIDGPKDEENAKGKKINKNLTEGFKNESFAVDFYSEKGKNTGHGKEHEKMSAYLIISEFQDKIKELVTSFMDKKYHLTNVYTKEYSLMDDLEFMARMVIGCHYYQWGFEDGKKYKYPYNNDHANDTWRNELQLRNCVIGLLNSSIDVDSLDYTSRDTKTSGYENTHVDIDRLLNSFSVIEGYKYEKALIKFNSENPINHPVTCENFVGEVQGLNLDGSCKIIAQEDEIIITNGSAIRGERLTEKKKEELESGKEVSAPDGYSTNISCKKIIINPPSSEKEKAYLYLSQGEINGLFSGSIYGQIKKHPDNYIKLYRLAFEKSSLSVIDGAALARNYEYLWIYAHHTITYQTNFLSYYLLDQYCTILYDRERKWLADEYEHELKAFNFSPYLKNEADTSSGNPNNNSVADIAERLSQMADTKKKIIQKKEDEASVSKSVDILQKILDTYERYKNFKEQTNLACSCEELIYNLFEWVYALYITYFEKDHPYWCKKGLPVIQYFLKDLIEGYMHRNNSDECIALSESLKIHEPLKKRFIDKVLQYMVDAIGVPERKTICGRAYDYSSDSDLYALYKEKKDELDVKAENFKRKKEGGFEINDEDEPTSHEKEFRCIAEESFSRQFAHSMWKTYAEYTHHFRGWTDEERNKLPEFFSDPESLIAKSYFVLSSNETITDSRKNEFFDYLREEYKIERFIYVKQIIKTKIPDNYHTYFNFNRSVLRMADIDIFKGNETVKSFCYFYYFRKKEYENRRLENMDIVRIIDTLHKKINIKPGAN
ncbi:hypothetical protein AGMMS49928_26590 [Spirochaetia bacterium]|nr:hypothetical protein AGMMS49928_26590 [Spirochaetia bacterium]